MPDNYVRGSFSEALKRGEELLPGEMRRLTGAVSELMVREVSRRTPIDTGKLVRSIEAIATTREPSPGVTIYRGGAKSDVDYASFVEYDTAPHSIDAVNTDNLVFWWKRRGVLFIGKHVNHPGTTGQHMFARGADAVEAQLDTQMEIMFARWKRRSGL